MKRHTSWMAAALVAGGVLGAPAGASAVELGTIGDFKFWIGGYIKLDTLYTSTSDGDIPGNSVGRDFYIPGTIPVGGGMSNDSLDFHAKESRINFKTAGTVGGMDITGFLEMDFQLPPGGDERVSNSYNPRLRQAYIKVDNFLFGQTWSTFQNVGALAENLDFIGPAEGTIFIRQPLIRVSIGAFDLAVENPETTVTPFGGGARIVTDDNVIPDFVGRFNVKIGEGGGQASLAAMIRTLDCDGCAPGVNDRTTGYGLSAAVKLPIGDQGDDIRAMISWGDGLGRYIGVNTANDAVIDASGDLETIGTLGGFVSLRHFWHPEWRSNLTLSGLKIDNDTALTGTGVTDRVYSVHANLIYQPINIFSVGAEYMYANRRIESGLSGNMHRIQFSAKLSI